MANLTITVSDDVLRDARIRAIEQGTSVNAILAEYLQKFAGRSAARQAMNEFLAFARASQASSGPEGRTWTRESLYDRRVLR